MYAIWPPQHELTLALTILYNYKGLFFYLTLNFNSHTTSPPSSPSHTRLTLDHFIILVSRSNLHCIFQLFSSVFSSVYKAVSKALYFWTPIQTHWILHLCIHSGKPCAETQGLQKPRIITTQTFCILGEMQLTGHTLTRFITSQHGHGGYLCKGINNSRRVDISLPPSSLIVSRNKTSKVLPARNTPPRLLSLPLFLPILPLHSPSTR